MIFHLTEDHLFEQHMSQLFGAAERFVIIYSSNGKDKWSANGRIRHRSFTAWIETNATDWTLWKHIPNRFPRRPWARRNRSFCEFYIYQRRRAAGQLDLI